MKRARSLAAAAACGLLVSGCTQFGLFEDVGSDPHRPSLEVISIATIEPVVPEPEPPPEPPPEPEPPVGPEPPPEPAARGRRARVIEWDSAGFTLRSGETIDVEFGYSDAGADVESVFIRDRDGDFSAEIKYAPEEIDTDGDGEPDTSVGNPGFWPGRSGRGHIAEGLLFDLPQGGPHRIEMWAVDSHESRSEKVQFTINVVF